MDEQAAVLNELGKRVGELQQQVDRLRADSFPEIRAMYQHMETVSALDLEQVVEHEYDRIAERYLEWAQSVRTEERTWYTSVLLDGLSPGAEVLDLGCGAGVPTTQTLARCFRVTGVDISARNIVLAQQNVPSARFTQADMTRLDFPPATFDAVAAFYSIIHVPRQEQPKLLQDIASWLRPGGLADLLVYLTIIASRRGPTEINLTGTWSSSSARST